MAVRFSKLVVSALAALAFAQSAPAETLKIASPQRGSWEGAIPELGKQQGIFQKHGLDLDIVYTSGGGETLQVVIGNAVDIGLSAGTSAVFGAFSKGAPIRVIAASSTGSAELFWYVPAKSPIQTIRDTTDATLAYSTTGASTHIAVMRFIRDYNLKAKPVATGNPTATITQVMSGQVDVGWAVAPFQLDALNKGEVRLVARASDIAAIREQTIRVQIVNAQTLAAKKDTIVRYLRAYRETIDWMYSSPEAITRYMAFSGFSEGAVRRMLMDFIPKESLQTDEVRGNPKARVEILNYGRECRLPSGRPRAEIRASEQYWEDSMPLKRLTLGVLTCALVLPVTAAKAQLVLNVNSWIPPAHLLVADITMPFCKDMEDVTQGRVKCNLLPKAVVVPGQTYDAVREGLADISFSANGYSPGRFVGTDVAEFPFLGDTSESISVAYSRIYERMISKLDEYKGLHVLGVFTHGPGQIFNTKRAVTSLKDLEGLKIRVGGSLVNDIASSIGTVPMLKPAPESYELLSQGVADGVFFPKEAALSFKLVPLIKHATFVPGGLYNVTFGLVMNEGKWKQISPADQAAINKLSGEALSRRAGKAWDAADARGEKAMRDAGIPIVMASPQFVAELKARLTPLESAWNEKAKAKGLDGAAALAALRAEIAKPTQ